MFWRGQGFLGTGAEDRQEPWPAGIAVTGKQDRLLGSGIFGNLPPQDIGPEPDQDSGIGAVKGDCEQRIAHG
jgi:hypothetical protein